MRGFASAGDALAEAGLTLLLGECGGMWWVHGGGGCVAVDEALVAQAVEDSGSGRGVS